MGEYADMALDAGFDQWGADEPDDYVWSGTLRRKRLPKLKTCRRCGMEGLHWGNTEGGWRLFEYSGFMTSTEHECPSVGTPQGVNQTPSLSPGETGKT